MIQKSSILVPKNMCAAYVVRNTLINKIYIGIRKSCLGLIDSSGCIILQDGISSDILSEASSVRIQKLKQCYFSNLKVFKSNRS